MKKSIVALLLSYAISPASAEVLPIQAQYGAPAGHSSMWLEDGTGGCKGNTPGIGQCYQIPFSKWVRYTWGTLTLKNPNSEVLARIICGTKTSYQQIWAAEIKTLDAPATTTFNAGPLPHDGPYQGNGSNHCWFEYQTDNHGTACPILGPGSGCQLEIQATVTVDYFGN